MPAEEKQMEPTRDIMIGALLVAFLSGCSLHTKLAGTEVVDGIDCRHGIRCGVDMEFLDVELDNDVKTTPVHPGDAGFLVGNTTTDIDSDFEDNANLVPYVGYDVQVGNENVKLVGGAMLRFNGVSRSDDYRDGIHGVAKQSSDVRPDANASFAYTYVDVGALTVEPDIGIRVKHDDSPVWAEFRVGFPYSRIEVESGWDRWGGWQKFDRDRWTGFGLRPSITVGSAETRAGQLVFLRAHYLIYDLGFGDMTGWGFSVGIEW